MSAEDDAFRELAELSEELGLYDDDHYPCHICGACHACGSECNHLLCDHRRHLEEHEMILRTKLISGAIALLLSGGVSAVIGHHSAPAPSSLTLNVTCNIYNPPSGTFDTASGNLSVTVTNNNSVMVYVSAENIALYDAAGNYLGTDSVMIGGIGNTIKASENTSDSGLYGDAGTVTNCKPVSYEDDPL